MRNVPLTAPSFSFLPFISVPRVIGSQSVYQLKIDFRSKKWFLRFDFPVFFWQLTSHGWSAVSGRRPVKEKVAPTNDVPESPSSHGGASSPTWVKRNQYLVLPSFLYSCLSGSSLVRSVASEIKSKRSAVHRRTTISISIWKTFRLTCLCKRSIR